MSGSYFKMCCDLKLTIALIHRKIFHKINIVIAFEFIAADERIVRSDREERKSSRKSGSRWRILKNATAMILWKQILYSRLIHLSYFEMEKV